MTSKKLPKTKSLVAVQNIQQELPPSRKPDAKSVVVMHVAPAGQTVLLKTIMGSVRLGSVHGCDKGTVSSCGFNMTSSVGGCKECTLAQAFLALQTRTFLLEGGFIAPAPGSKSSVEDCDGFAPTSTLYAC